MTLENIASEERGIEVHHGLLYRQNYDGWVLRFCEKEYEQAKLPIVYKLTPDSQPRDIVDLLK